MSQDQISQFQTLSREFRHAKAENDRRKTEIEAAVGKAKKQLAAARELLARLDGILNSSNIHRGE